MIQPIYSDTYKRFVLFALTASVGLIPFMVSALTLALPEIGRKFETNPVTLGWILTVYLLSASVLQIPIGNFADQTGRKCFFLKLGLLIFVAMSVCCALSPTIHWMIGFRLVQGVGSAMVFGTNIAILSDVFPASERSRAFGLNSGVIFLCLTSGPFIGGWLTYYFGWRSIFWLCAVWGVLGWGLAQKILQHEKIHTPQPGVHQDYLGAAIYGLSLTLWICGLAELPARLGWILLVGSVPALLAFVWQEFRSPNPMLDLRVLRGNRQFCFSSLASLISYSATYGVGYVLSLYLKEVRDCDTRTAGFVLLTQSLSVAICSPIVGSSISGRWSDRLLATLGISVNAIALFLLMQISTDTSLWYVIAVLVFFGVGIALFITPNTNAVMDSVEAEHYGMASAMTGTVRMTGQATSASIAMMMIATISGRVQITEDNKALFLSSLHWILGIFAVLCVVGALASLARKKTVL